MQVFLLNLMMSLSLSSFSQAYSPSAWGLLKSKLLQNPTRLGSACVSQKTYSHIFHTSKLSNIQGILKSKAILPRSQVVPSPEQLFKDCDCNPEVVYTTFRQQQVLEDKCVFRFPVDNLEEFCHEQEKINEIFISGFYNLGQFDPNFSSTIKDINKFKSLLNLPGHELIIPCALELKSGVCLLSHQDNSRQIREYLDELGYSYRFSKEGNYHQFDME